MMMMIAILAVSCSNDSTSSNENEPSIKNTDILGFKAEDASASHFLLYNATPIVGTATDGFTATMDIKNSGSNPDSYIPISQVKIAFNKQFLLI